MKQVLMMSFFLLLGVSLMGQQKDLELAKHYYKQGEYEKSSQLFKKLSVKSNGYNEYYYNQYIESLMAMEEYEMALKDIRATLKKRPGIVELYVTYGNLLERQGRVAEAEAQFDIAIEKLGPDRRAISNLGNSFTRLTKYDLALKAFEKGESLLGNEGTFSYYIAELYRRKNDTERMIHYYLQSPTATIERISSVQNYFDKVLSEGEDYDMLRKKLYEKVQEDSDNIFYPEMIEWVFIKNKEYSKALRQARALDRRLEENGARIYSIAQIAANDKDYDTAITAYQYILDEKDQGSGYYIDSKRALLNTKRKKIVNTSDYTKQDLIDLKSEYMSFLDETGRGKNTAFIMLELAKLEGLYLNDLDAAVATLNHLVEMPGANNYVRATAKIELGDYYLMQGEVWESTLLYSQVDKEFKEDFLGEKARFKNAKLSYFTGDFDWAQEQFDILKSATTKLISNDAIDLSVFIMDNANLDTTYRPMEMYAQAELFLFQNKIDEAFAKFDSISMLFPDHTLQDDVLFAKAQNFEQRKMYKEAAALYTSIIELFPEDIRADNAIYALGVITEEQFEDTEEAQRLFEKIFIEYSDSTFSIDARKRYRLLRGDNIQ